MNITYFLEKLAKPLLIFANGVWDLFIKMDVWWTAKNTHTKIHLRWMGILVFVIVIGVIRELRNTNENIAHYNRLLSLYNICQEKGIESDKWKYEHLQERISELKEIEKLVIKNTQTIEKIKE